MTSTDTSSYYRVYLLTVWQERSPEPVRGHAWRFRLEDPRNGEQRGFAGAEELVTALQVGLDRDGGASVELGEAEEGE